MASLLRGEFNIGKFIFTAYVVIMLDILLLSSHVDLEINDMEYKILSMMGVIN